jgi:allantoin racemase
MIQAEEEGYDACIPFGMVDFGVELARHHCRIPIVGQAQATYSVAAVMVDRIGCVFYNTNAGDNARHWRQARDYGIAQRIVGFGGAEMRRQEFHPRRQELFERFVAEGKRLVGLGAELIICHGMSMSPVEFPAREYAEGIGVPVLEGMGCAIAMAEAWVHMGTPVSRIRYPG